MYLFAIFGSMKCCAADFSGTAFGAGSRMEFTGLLVHFPVDRPLTDQERANQLQQSARLDVVPNAQLCVIKLNATYLESVDKWFAWKGLLTSMAITFVLFFGPYLAYAVAHDLLTAAGYIATEESQSFMVASGVGMGAVLALICWANWRLFKSESFALTHYPIRFNRKTRTVHFFRIDRTTKSVAWDDVFFTLGYCDPQWEVRGHILAADRTTVLDTFALSYSGHIPGLDLFANNAPGFVQDQVHAHWEFVRRYMEEGPQEVAPLVPFCIPVDARRESILRWAQRACADSDGWSLFILVLATPIWAWMSLGRIIAMRTSKIPQWPQEIEAVCRVEPNDLETPVHGNGKAELTNHVS
jgi:hypothetical protein